MCSNASIRSTGSSTITAVGPCSHCLNVKIDECLHPYPLLLMGGVFTTHAQKQSGIADNTV